MYIMPSVLSVHCFVLVVFSAHLFVFLSWKSLICFVLIKLRCTYDPLRSPHHHLHLNVTKHKTRKDFKMDKAADFIALSCEELPILEYTIRFCQFSWHSNFDYETIKSIYWEVILTDQ